jgi:hypothetical protein
MKVAAAVPNLVRENVARVATVDSALRPTQKC